MKRREDTPDRVTPLPSSAPPPVSIHNSPPNRVCVDGSDGVQCRQKKLGRVSTAAGTLEICWVWGAKHQTEEADDRAVSGLDGGNGET